MPTNITVMAIDAPAVVYLQDGTSTVIDPGQQGGIQLIAGGFCTVSEAVSHDEEEHMPPGTVFAEAMIAFWDRMREKFRKAAQQPTVNPVEVEVD